MKIEILPAFADNYIYVIDMDDTVVIVDPGEASPVIEWVSRSGKKPTQILLTHHHGDHIGGVHRLKQLYDPVVIGAKADRNRLPTLDLELEDGHIIVLGEAVIQAIETPGHTLGHIAYWCKNLGSAFVGDTLFSLGCGGLFEGTASQMWESLKKLRDLPDETRLYCGHEYTLPNGRFALTLEPDNPALQQRLAEASQLRAAGKPTLPCILEQEKAANPFLRADLPYLASQVGKRGSQAAEVFATIRSLKDNFS